MLGVDHRLFSIRFAGTRLLHAGRNWSSCEPPALFAGAMLRCPSRELLEKQLCFSVKGKNYRCCSAFQP